MSGATEPPTAAVQKLSLDKTTTNESSDLAKVDSAVQGLEPASPSRTKPGHRRKSSSDNNVVDIKTLDRESVKFSDEIAQLGWKINASTSSAADKEVLKKMLTDPPVKSIEFCMPLTSDTAGIEFKVVKPKGVTIKDVMDKLSKKYKDKHDEDLPFGEQRAFLQGFVWNAHLQKFIVQLGEESLGGGSGKKKKKEKKEDS